MIMFYAGLILALIILALTGAATSTPTHLRSHGRHRTGRRHDIMRALTSYHGRHTTGRAAAVFRYAPAFV